MKKLFKFIFSTDYFKSFLLSFYYFPFRDAIKLPILVSYRTDIQSLRGEVRCSGKVSTGMLMFGYNGLKIVDNRYDRTKWCLRGNIILEGKVRIGRGSNLVVAETGTCVFGIILQLQEEVL